ncbi:XopAD/skwp family type III secretion system effector [Rhizobium leguminosarum]|uniref:XopAD/skwp family type III secretion system effector n=1 Tax=Rhizobium leguminosarum TaxID=384 RepID=UPI0021B1140F|nr:XopAD/skwp family type III secretion system effector [Rhizobium leguminosarum]MBY3026608.1 type III effector protein XopAD [Rhizobium leguminosarum]
MKTSDDNPNSLLTNLPHSQEEQPRPTEDQAAASTRGNHQGRPPAKRRRIEPDEPGTSTRRGQPFSVNARIVASEGARDSHVRQHAVTRSRRRRGTAPERRPDRMPADGSVSSSHRGPQRPTYGLGATAGRLTEQQSDRTAGKRPREEPYRQRKRPRHRLELAEYLRQAERQLSSVAKKKLHAEQKSYQQQLDDANAGLCVTMAKENQLAHRITGRLALPFLEERLDAQTNAERLDKYLQMIANARRATGAGIKYRDLDRCTELAAQYLCETEWFEGASLKQLAHVGNKLSKHPNQQACMDAIAWIAGQLNERRANDLSVLRGTPSVLLLNAFAKNINSGRCERAVARLARYLKRDDQARQSLNSRDIGLVLNTFSKWFDNSDCRSMAHSLAALLASDSRLRHAMGAQSVANALNALSKWPDTAVCAAAVGALAGRLADEPGMRNALDPLGVANALNALSKWPDTTVCKNAAKALAGRLAAEPGMRKALDPQGVANALTALSKWPDTAVCAEAVCALAGRLADEPGLRKALDPQGVATALNALSKWPDTADCAAAAKALAGRLVAEPALRKALAPQQVANALNALSKWPDTADCAAAVKALAGRLAAEPALRNTLNGQGVSNALNALSKWPDTADCAAVAKALAGRLAAEPGLRKALEPQGVANALNALSKWPNTTVCKNAAKALAGRLAAEPGLRKALAPQQVANALNALSKWPDTAVCAAAAKALAGWLAAEPGLRNTLNGQGVSNALNALSKWPDTADCAAAAKALAGRLAAEPALRNTLNGQGVSNALNALSKWPDTADCAEAVNTLAGRLTAEPGLRNALDPQGVSASLNALSRCLGRPACQTAGLLLAERAGLAELPWQQFEMRMIAMVANAVSRLLHLDEEQLQTLGGAKLQAMAGHLELHRERFESASVLDIGMLFKALAAARLHRQMRPLARPALERVSVLVGDDRLRETNLESIGNLCMGLLPLIRSPELNSRHRGHALRVFNTLQPIVERKIDLYLTGGDSQSSTDIDQHATRCPALTFFQVLKAYSMVSRQWKPRHVEGTRQELRQRRDQLATWVDRTLERTREAIEADLGEMSWNLIAQIEAGDQTFDALDLRMAKEAPTITQAHPPTRFDLEAGRSSMCSVQGQPRVPANGSTTHVVVDLQGKEVSNKAIETNQQYSLFSRLTGLPLVEVQLPGAISTFMLARTFNYQGEPWRLDLFGGSRATRGNMSRPAQLLSGTSAAPSLLPAIRYSDTARDSSLMKLVAKLAPQREDWSRMQRSLLEMVPRDHVIEGTLRLGFFEDVSGPEHPFKPLAVDGRPLALCPNDGCGFLKLEVALRIPAFRKHYDAWQAVQAGQASQEQRELLAKDKGPTRLAPQALQHFPRDEAALQEAHEAMQHRLEALPPEELSQLTLFELATSGGYQGQRVRAVPSADDKVHLPRERSQVFDAAGGPLLIGKPPYDKENLLPVPEERVATVAKGDATAEFLSQSFGIQYSYTGFDDLSGDDAQMLHSKGMLILVPEKNWPADFVNTDLVCSKEDLKTLSCWTAGRDRSAVPREMLSTGSLRLKDIVEPGRMGALPIAELRKRDMDTDGDDAFVYAGYPRLAALIERVMDDRTARRGQPQSYKPRKTATPAIDRETGHYKAGRLSEIMSMQRGGEIMGAASNLAARFMAQPDQLREAMARNMMFGTYDGIERDLRTGLREVLEGDARDPQVLAKLSADAGDAIERAHMPEAREAAQLLHAQLLRLDPQVFFADMPQLSDALAEAFPNLAKEYVAAPSVEARIHAILDNYPVCRLSHAQFPAGQPGFIPNEPELTMRNLFTIAIKVGTDALKSDTGTALFAKIVEACERSERGFAERVRVVPYSKATARAMHDDKFDAEQTKGLLQHMPTMAAGVMQDALHALQQARLIDPPPPPAERLRDVRTEDITLNAKSLLTRARDMEPVVTEMLNRAAVPYGGRLVGTQHQLKSLGSLKEKLKQQMALKKQTLEEATAGVNDALRYSVALNPQNFTVGLRRVLASLDDQGHERVKMTNTFTKRRPTFKAVNVTLRSPKGALWEIQFHTPETFKLKERFHDRYKRNHALQMKGTPLADQCELQAAQEAYSLVALPPGCGEIDDWVEAALPAAEISQAGTSRSRAVPRKPARVALSPKAGEIRAALGTRPVVLVGMPTSGKSTIGRHLAKELGLDFLDTDKCIIAEHGDVTRIFADRGEGYFRDLEAKELAKCLEKGSLVIATGGGCFDKESNRALILNKAKSIWLDTDLNEIKKRLKNDRSRPLLQVDNREETVDKLYKERSRFYQQADIRVPLVPPLGDKKDARICVEKLYDLLCNGREAALPAAEISHVSGTSGTAISMSPTAQRMHDDHPNRVKGVVETIQAPAAPLSEAERQPPLLVGSNARADLASSSRSRERLSRGR